MARHQEFAFLVHHAGNLAWNGRAVYVYIEDVQKNADPRFSRAKLPDGNYLAVGWRNHHIAHRGRPLRIPKKIQAEHSNDIEGDARPRRQEIRKNNSDQGQTARVVNAVTDNTQTSIFSRALRFHRALQ